MLRIVQNTSPAGAKSYYSTADYYTEGQELEGIWRGAGAMRLGLSGKVEQEAWDALCDNRNPAMGCTLTARQKQERRVGYDFNFHVPKSVSLLYSVTKDERLLHAFRDSVRETMGAMESEMKSRVRVGGKNEDRTTGNMVWGEFVHFTSRPVDGIPDPHLHAHCFVFNTTFDDKEQRWKAGQFAGLKRDAPYFEGVFHAKLARRLAELGVPVERTRTGWEITGIPRSALERFSRRTTLIEAEAEARGVTDAQEKAELGAKTRERKNKNLSLDELRKEWLGRMSESEQTALTDAGRNIGGIRIGENTQAASEAVDRSVEHWFERKSVVPERQLLATALKNAVGQASVAMVEREFGQRNMVVAERDGRRMATTGAVLEEERGMIDFARKGRGTCPRLGAGDYRFKNNDLNREQVAAVLHIINSRDVVTLLRGGAGVGKTWSMSEAAQAIEENGKHVFAFAPSADASRRVLREAGFGDADTVARLLADPRMQDEVRGQVIWIDEAGLLGTRTMARVFDLANQLDARVVLSGDTRQHGAVERGAALRLLETEAGLVPAEIKEIQRQSGQYKQLVQALGEGHTEAGFKQLDDLKWIREVPEAERYKALAADYVGAVTAGKSALVVSPTHLEGEWCTDEIRAELRRTGKLRAEQRQLQVLDNADLTQAQRRDPLNYLPGDVIVFHQNAKPGIRKGTRLVVGETLPPLALADKFQVFHPGTLAVSPGETLRITRNGKSADGLHDLNNGDLVTVEGFTPHGDLKIVKNRTRTTLSKDYGHLNYGYVVTSHASQGMSVQRVFIGQSSESFPASSREQFYVSVSRGKEQVTIYTDDKDALLQAVNYTDERLTALEMFHGHQVQQVRIEGLEQRLHDAAAERGSQQQREELGHAR